jgi:uncharacterized protein YjfI (DUF2170 family)
MYYSIKDVWAGGKTMYTIRNRYNEEQSKFKDISALGVFVDNHDNARFLISKKTFIDLRMHLLFQSTQLVFLLFIMAMSKDMLVEMIHKTEKLFGLA